MIRYKSSQQNRVPIALSRHAHLLSSLQTEITNFEALKDPYFDDKIFLATWDQCTNAQLVGNNSIRHKYLFKGNLLDIPKSSLHMQMIKELHSGGLVAHLGQHKIVELLQKWFF